MPYHIPLLAADIDIEARKRLIDLLAGEDFSAQGGLEQFHQAIQPLFPRHSVLGLSSCTAALHLALQLAGVREGERVLCPTFTFAATVNPILYCGAIPVFIDSEAESWNMDPALLEDALADYKREGKRVAAIVLVHAYGTPAKLREVQSIAAAYEVPLLEDAAAALGAFYEGQMAGTFGMFGAYSFNQNKIITTAGGGLLLSREQALIRQADFLANQARANAPYYHHEQIGYNYRMNGLAAQLGAIQFPRLNEKLAHKKALFDTYRKALAGVGGIHFQEFPDIVRPNYWLTSFLLPGEEQKNMLYDGLHARGIECRMLWRPMHYQPAFREFTVYNRGVAEKLFQSGLSLPSSFSLQEEQQAEVIRHICQLLSAG